MNWISIFVSIIITVSVYLFIPIILILINKKWTLKQIKFFAIFNGTTLWLAFRILQAIIFVDTNQFDTSPALIWSYVGYCLMKKRIIKADNAKVIKEIISNVEKKQSSTIHKSTIVGYSLAITFFILMISVFVVHLNYKDSMTVQIASFERQLNEQTNQIDQQKKALDGNNFTITQLRKNIRSLQDVSNEIINEKDDLEMDIYFWNKHACLVYDDGTNLYHRSNCPNIDLNEFWIYNIEAAKGDGYFPCSICY